MFRFDYVISFSRSHYLGFCSQLVIFDLMISVAFMKVSEYKDINKFRIVLLLQEDKDI